MKKILTILAAGAIAVSATACTDTQSTVQSGSADQVQEILSEMDLEHKIAQMIMPSVRDEEGSKEDPNNCYGLTELTDSAKKAIEEYGFGGYIFFVPNCQSPEQMSKLTSQMQMAATGDNSKVQIPLLLSVDQEGGNVSRVTCGTLTPSNMAIGASGNTDNAKADAKVIGNEIASVGFNVDFAPVVDVNSNPNNPIIGIRSFGSDANNVSSMETKFIEGLEEENIISSLKHFPGHGDTDTDSHTGLPLVNKTEEELLSNELVTFKAGIDAGADMIMTAHIVYPQIEKDTYTSKSTGEEIGIPATLSDDIITGILRDELGYEGVVVTDSMRMDAVAENFDEIDAAEMAINAGVDILNMPFDIATDEGIEDFKEYIQGIKERVESGKISEDTINKAVTRILTLKEEKGILDQTEYWKNLTEEEVNAKAQAAKENLGSEEHEEIIEEVTNDTITLIKNDNNALPLDGKVLFLVPKDMCKYAVEEALERLTGEGKLPEGVETKTVCYENMTVDEVCEEVEWADKVVGLSTLMNKDQLNPSTEKGANSAKLHGALAAVQANGGKFILVSGYLPYDIASYQDADAILASYCYRSVTSVTEVEGEIPDIGPSFTSAVCAAFGEFEPTGKLPVDIPVLDENYSYTDEILYPLGYSGGKIIQ